MPTMQLATSRCLLAAALVVVLVAAVAVAHSIPAHGKRSFGSYGKYDRNEGKVGTDETVLLEQQGAGCVHNFWFAADYPGVEQTLFRIYVNGEETPSVEDLLMRRAYWTGDRRYGSVAPMSFYMAIPIPFKAGIRITAQLSPRYRYPEPQYAYWTIRGVLGVPAAIGSFVLPDDAKLVLVSKTRYLKATQKEAFLDVRGSSGMLYHVEVNIKGKNLDFMEGPVVSTIDGSEVVLGTGMDDYFNSAWWMKQSEARYTLPSAMGVIERGDGLLIAYRVHEHDPVLFTESLTFEWQNGAAFSSGAIIGHPEPLRATFDFWMYTWPKPTASAPRAEL